MKQKLESRLQGEISITSDIQMTPPYGRKRRSKELLDENERVKKLKTKVKNSTFRKLRSWHPVASLHGK